MIEITRTQRAGTAVLMFAVSIIGVVCALYLIRAAHVLLLRASASWLETAAFALGGLFLLLVVLLNWLGAYCLTHRYASSVTCSNGELEVTTDTRTFRVDRELVSFWTTGKMFVAGATGGVEFVVLLVGFRLLLCAKANAQGIS